MSTRRDEIAKLLNSTTPKRPPHKFARSAYVVLVAALIGTTLPDPSLNVLLSMVALLAAFSLLFTARGYLKKTAFLCALSFSLLSGCSGLLLEDGHQFPVELCGPGIECHTGRANGWALFGFGLSHINPETAKRNGNLEQAIGVYEMRSYGLVSVAKVEVYGK